MCKLETLKSESSWHLALFSPVQEKMNLCPVIELSLALHRRYKTLVIC